MRAEVRVGDTEVEGVVVGDALVEGVTDGVTDVEGVTDTVGVMDTVVLPVTERLGVRDAVDEADVEGVGLGEAHTSFGLGVVAKSIGASARERMTVPAGAAPSMVTSRVTVLTRHTAALLEANRVKTPPMQRPTRPCTGDASGPSA